MTKKREKDIEEGLRKELEDELEKEFEIDENMLRERAEKLPAVTDKLWEKVDEHNREIVQDYFDSNAQVSVQTLKQYRSGMRQFFYWIKLKAKNKPMYEITKRDFIKYRSDLMRHGLSSSSLGFKQSSVSTLCNHIENIYADYDERYDNFRNFTRGLPTIPRNQVYEKVAITKDDYDLIMKELQEDKDYLGMAWAAAAFNMGGRRAEIIQLKTEILDYEFEKDSDGNKLNFILVGNIRGKGFGEDGKPLEYMINDEALKYMRLWVEKRGYDHEDIFTVIYKGEPRRMGQSWANYFCTNTLSPILGRRVNPHIFKASAISYLLENGRDLGAVSKYVAHHESTETTSQHYDLRSDEDERNSIF